MSPSNPDPKPEQRSSWLLRILFACIVGILTVETLIVAVLVGYTVLVLNDRRAVAGTETTPVELDVGLLEEPVEESEPATLDGVDVWDRHGPVNILLLGLDHDSCADPDVELHRSDTMILVRVDPGTGEAAMMSLPRDLFVYIEPFEGCYACGGKKLTVAHYLGELYDYEPAGGAGLTKKVIRDNFDLPVHRYARIDFEGFQRIIDEVGPLEVVVPPSPDDPTIGLYDTEYPDGNCGTMTVEFPPGRVELDGERALQYARSRKSTSDFDRSRRQMQVLEAIRERVSRVGILLDLPGLIPALQETVDTDLSAQEIISLARVARGMSSEDVVRLAIDENYVYDDLVEIDGVPQAVLRHRPGPWRDLRDRFQAIEPEPSPTPTATPWTAPTTAIGASSTASP